ncbi:MAG: VOC family protein [Myxococcota bacterium]|nr:VOC family protein [Myxococcota bacterium]
MADSNKKGQLVWYDFITRDIEKAKAFYAALFDWQYEAFDMGPEGIYDMIKVGDKTIGGFMTPNGPNADTLPAHWTAYVYVRDVAETVNKAKRLGGTVPVGPVDIPNMGAFGVSVDKEQAGISFYSANNEPEETPEEDQMASIGEFCWTECMVDDTERAKAYYGELFGWAYEPKNMGEGCDTYWIAKAADSHVAGIMKKSTEHKGPSCWLSYVFVKDLENTLKQAETLGGQIIAPPMPIPEVGRIAVILDNQGGMIGLFADPIMPE